jgi:hypothetical protein
MWSRHFHLPFGGQFLPFWCCCCLNPVAMRRLISGGCARSPSPDAWLLLVCFLMSLCWADAGTLLVCCPPFSPPGVSFSLRRPPFSTVFAEPQCSNCLYVGCTFDRDTFVAPHLVTCFTVHDFTPFRAPHVGRHFAVTVVYTHTLTD